MPRVDTETDMKGANNMEVHINDVVFFIARGHVFQGLVQSRFASPGKITVHYVDRYRNEPMNALVRPEELYPTRKEAEWALNKNKWTSHANGNIQEIEVNGVRITIVHMGDNNYQIMSFPENELVPSFNMVVRENSMDEAKSCAIMALRKKIKADLSYLEGLDDALDTELHKL